MTDRHGERDDRADSDPAPTISTKARSARWYDRRQGHGQGGGTEDGAVGS